MLDFNNTETAFAGRTDSDIRRSYRLFGLMRYNGLVSLNQLILRIALFLGLPVRWVVKPTIFRQFCGGESFEECNKTIAFLAEHNVKTIIDFAAEGKQTEEAFEAVINEKIRAMQALKGNPHAPFSVLKVTGIARMELLKRVSQGTPLSEQEIPEWNKVKERLHRLCRETAETGFSILIDAEESWIQNAIDSLVMEMMNQFNKSGPVVYNTYQFYRWDRLNVMKEHHRSAIAGGFIFGVKPVRGAYLEKERQRAEKFNYPSPVHKTKEETDRDYNECLKYCVENISAIALCNSTHNEKSCYCLAELMNKNGIEAHHPRIWFAQLYGMSDHITFNLAKGGYNAAKHLPFGRMEEVLPYLMRRAEENTSFADQTGRELSLYKKEFSRRNA